MPHTIIAAWPGDVVEMSTTPHINSTGGLLVLKVTQRRGLNPLLSCVAADDRAGKQSRFDAALVRRIVLRGRNHPESNPVNTFAPQENQRSPRIPGTGYAKGCLRDLVEYYLGSMNFGLSGEINMERITRLNQLGQIWRIPGVCGRYYLYDSSLRFGPDSTTHGTTAGDVIKVRIDPFKKWVKANAHSLVVHA